MALHISFKPGIKQSQQAASYFHETVGSLVETMIDGLEGRQYLISSEKGGSLRLQIWSAKALEQTELHELFEWILAVRADMERLHTGPAGPDQLEPLAASWLAERMGGADLFVELSIVLTGSQGSERPEFSLGVVRGRSVMISTDTLLFTWLDDGIFGLSMAGHGSYLLELIEADAKSKRQWRKAS